MERSFSSVPGGPEVLQRKCTACEEDPRHPCPECAQEELKLARWAEGNGPSPGVTGGLIHEVLESAGEPLDPAVRAAMQPSFGHDFSQVRVHTDRRASTSADAVNARAYTVGHHVVFRSGSYGPRSLDGQRLIAHELTHVVQQGGAPPLGGREGAARPDTELDSHPVRAFGRADGVWLQRAEEAGWGGESDISEAETASDSSGFIPEGCSPCVGGWKLCHKLIVPDDGSCTNLFGDYWRCRC
jgi:hypothetical protein